MPALDHRPHLTSALWQATASCLSPSPSQGPQYPAFNAYLPQAVPHRATNVFKDFKDGSRRTNHRKQQYGMGYNTGFQEVYNDSMDNWTRYFTSLGLSFLVYKMGTMIPISLSH